MIPFIVAAVMSIPLRAAAQAQFLSGEAVPLNAESVPVEASAPKVLGNSYGLSIPITTLGKELEAPPPARFELQTSVKSGADRPPRVAADAEGIPGFVVESALKRSLAENPQFAPDAAGTTLEIRSGGSLENRSAWLQKYISQFRPRDGGSLKADELNTLFEQAEDDAEARKNAAAPLPTQGSASGRGLKPGGGDAYLKYLDDVLQAKKAGNNRVDFLVDAKEFLPRVFEDIDSARHNIHVEFCFFNVTTQKLFEFNPDWEIARHFAEKLAEKARGGMPVRLMVSRFGQDFSKSWLQKRREVARLLRFLRQAGVEVRRAKTRAVDRSDARWGRVTRRLSRWMHIDHRKIVVIDGRIGYLGGMNIGFRYLFRWHDHMSRIIGPIVARLQNTFIDKWRLSGGRIDPKEWSDIYPPADRFPDGVETRIIRHFGWRDRFVKEAYLRLIQTVGKNFKAVNPLLSDPDIIDALCAAASRGIRVQLLLPRDNIRPILGLFNRSYYARLLGAGVEIYEFRGTSHLKTAIGDDRYVIDGSSNLDAWSLFYNDEINMVVADPFFAGQVNQRVFDPDLSPERSDRILHHRTSVLEWLARGATKISGIFFESRLTPS